MALEKNTWIDAAHTQMRLIYGISLSDAGIGGDEMFTRFGNNGNQTPRKAVVEFGDKYGLTPVHKRGMAYA